MRGSVHVTGTHRPDHWDQFTAVRACVGPSTPTRPPPPTTRYRGSPAAAPAAAAA
ncbi:hypothetical protein [Streptomyces sp. NPDC001139]